MNLIKIKFFILITILGGSNIYAQEKQDNVFSNVSLTVSAPVWFKNNDDDSHHIMLEIVDGGIVYFSQNHNGEDKVRITLNTELDRISLSYLDYDISIDSYGLHEMKRKGFSISQVINGTNYLVRIRKTWTRVFHLETIPDNTPVSIKRMDIDKVIKSSSDYHTQLKSVSNLEEKMMPELFRWASNEYPDIVKSIWDTKNSSWYLNIEFTFPDKEDLLLIKAKATFNKEGKLEFTPFEGVIKGSEEWKYFSNLIDLRYPGGSVFERVFEKPGAAYIYERGEVNEEVFKSFLKWLPK